MSLRLAKKRANWRANRRLRREEVGLFPSFYYSFGCVAVGQGHENIPHKHIPFTVARYAQVVKEYENAEPPQLMLQIAKAFNLRDNRWDGLAAVIDQMVESGIKVELINKCILADHLNVWKKFDITLVSRREWDKAAIELDRLIASV